MDRKIWVTEADRERLEKLLEGPVSPRDAHHFKALQDELKKAAVVEAKKVPSDVITMNSEVIFEYLDYHRVEKYTLVYPEKADAQHGRLSVLAPLGCALLGYRKGDTIEFTTPYSTRKIKVLGITYQPEAAGDFHL